MMDRRDKDQIVWSCLSCSRMRKEKLEKSHKRLFLNYIGSFERFRSAGFRFGFSSARYQASESFFFFFNFFNPDSANNCCRHVVSFPSPRGAGNHSPWRHGKETLFILSRTRAPDPDPALHLAPVTCQLRQHTPTHTQQYTLAASVEGEPMYTCQTYEMINRLWKKCTQES